MGDLSPENSLQNFRRRGLLGRTSILLRSKNSQGEEQFIPKWKIIGRDIDISALCLIFQTICQKSISLLRFRRREDQFQLILGRLFPPCIGFQDPFASERKI